MDKFKVKMPNGYLMVEAKGVENEYPGVYVSFSSNGENNDVSKIIACVEYDSCTGEILTETYTKGEENPNHIIVHDDGRDKC
jgi:hypothetical protein